MAEQARRGHDGRVEAFRVPRHVPRRGARLPQGEGEAWRRRRGRRAQGIRRARRARARHDAAPEAERGAAQGGQARRAARARHDERAMAAPRRGKRGSLAEYRKKRDFRATPEPAGSTPNGRTPPSRSKKRPSSGGVFVVQKHDATRLHYDFRLELDGVLRRGRCRRGRASTRREAPRRPVEDHPIEYGDFEGVIPKGEYGGGPVIVWDRGRWTPEGDPLRGLREGPSRFALDGEKLRGRLGPRAMHGRRGENGRAWLLVKRRTHEAQTGPEADLAVQRPESVVSRREDRGPRGTRARQPRAHRAQGTRAVRALARARALADAASASAGADRCPAPRRPRAAARDARRRAARGRRVAPRDQVRRLPHPRAHRATAARRCSSRNGKDWTARFPARRDARRARCRSTTRSSTARSCVLRRDGKTSLPGAAGRARRRGAGALRLLRLRPAPPRRPRPRAAAAARAQGGAAGAAPARRTPVLRYSDHVVGDGAEFLAPGVPAGLEGIVSKRADAPYVGRPDAGVA